MPSKIDNYKIDNPKLDRRTKLTQQQKEEIKLNRFDMSQRELAEFYKVSRRTIQFILDPKKLEENKKRREERGGWKQYYDKDKNREAVYNTRNYKKDLLNKGLIK